MGLFGLTGSQLFLKVLHLSLIAMPALGVLALARELLKKAPRRAVCLLWLVFWLRLLTPFTIQIPWGLPVEQNLVPRESAAVEVDMSLPNALDAARRAVGGALSGGDGTIIVQIERPSASGGTASLTRGEVWLIVFAWLWQIGMAGMLAYSAVSLARLRLRLRGAVKLEGHVYLADRAGSPFVLGLLRPRIYLPTGLPESDRDLILRHERAHIRGWHHLWKPLAFLALAVHWCNPLVWLAFHLFVSDLEAACDEAATAELDRGGRADYAAALLRLSAPRRAILSPPLAFGEGDAKSRIRRVLDFQRPRTWAVAAVMVLAVALGGFMLTSRDAAADYPIGAEYQLGSVAYQTGGYYGDSRYFVSGDYRLWAMNPLSSDTPLTDLGQLEPCDMTRQELLRYCPRDEFWQGRKPGRITQSWWLRVDDNPYKSAFYALFRTTDGDTWLAWGSEDISERAPHGEDPSDDTSVHWLVKLEQAPMESIGRYFVTDRALTLGGGAETTVLGTLECGERTAAYVDYWYGTDGSVGFAVYRGGSRGGLLSPDRSMFVERTALYTYSPDELTETVPGSGVYTLPVDFPLEYDGKAEMRAPVLCLNENVYSIQRTAARAGGTVLSQESDTVMGRGMVFFSSLPDTTGQEVAVTYRFFNELGNEVFFESANSGQDRPVILPPPEGQGFDTALEWFWSDGTYDYYFPCVISEYILVEYPDGSRKPFAEALAAGDVTLGDLEWAGIAYYAEPLNRSEGQGETVQP